VDSARCPACRADEENTEHFLLRYPSYAHKRWTLIQHARKKCKALMLEVLLGDTYSSPYYCWQHTYKQQANSHNKVSITQLRMEILCDKWIEKECTECNKGKQARKKSTDTTTLLYNATARAVTVQMLINMLKPKDTKQVAPKVKPTRTNTGTTPKLAKGALWRTHIHACQFSHSTHHVRMATDAMGEKMA
jgi:hypothetical protein